MINKKTRKGVTPVIATVLLITIGIAAVSSAAVFFTELSDQITGGVEDRLSQEEQIDQSEISMDQAFTDEDEEDLFIDVRNTGSVLMPIRENNQNTWSLFLDDAPEENWEFVDNVDDEEDYINPQETVRIRIEDGFPQDLDETTQVSINAPYESGASTTCHNSGDRQC